MDDGGRGKLYPASGCHQHLRIAGRVTKVDKGDRRGLGPCASYQWVAFSRSAALAHSTTTGLVKGVCRKTSAL